MRLRAISQLIERAPRTALGSRVVLLPLALTLLAQTPDIPGSKDHPLISRYPGSHITFYAVKEYDQYNFPVGRVGPDGVPKTQSIEGKITRVVYAYPQDRSSLEVFRNYQSALKQAGASTIFECSGDACGLSRWNSSGDWYDMWVGAGDHHYSGKLSRPEGDAYFSVHVSVNKYAVVDVVEPKAMEGGLVTVNAAALAGDIGRTGHAAVYGIYFDTGRADIKPESEATLKEIAKLLQQEPTLRLYVVGHTDSTGDFAANMDLSKRRADAVVKALTGPHRVAEDRLQSFGSGPLAPVASNRTEEGRAKNRRVELVER